jgi:hypothetical protein
MGEITKDFYLIDKKLVEKDVRGEGENFKDIIEERIQQGIEIPIEEIKVEIEW